MTETAFDYITYNCEEDKLVETSLGPYLIAEACELKLFNHEDHAIHVDICPIITITQRKSDGYFNSVSIDVEGGAILADHGYLQVNFGPPCIYSETIESNIDTIAAWKLRLQYIPIKSRILPNKDLGALNDRFMFEIRYFCESTTDLEISECTNTVPDKYQVCIDITDSGNTDEASLQDDSHVRSFNLFVNDIATTTDAPTTTEKTELGVRDTLKYWTVVMRGFK